MASEATDISLLLLAHKGATSVQNDVFQKLGRPCKPLVQLQNAIPSHISCTGSVRGRLNSRCCTCYHVSHSSISIIYTCEDSVRDFFGCPVAGRVEAASTKGHKWTGPTGSGPRQQTPTSVARSLANKAADKNTSTRFQYSSSKAMLLRF